MIVYIFISFKDTIILKDCKEKLWLLIFFGESKIFFIWRRRSLKKYDIDIIKDIVFNNVLWLMFIKLVYENLRLNIYSFKKIIKK